MIVRPVAGGWLRQRSRLSLHCSGRSRTLAQARRSFSSAAGSGCKLLRRRKHRIASSVDRSTVEARGQCRPRRDQRTMALDIQPADVLPLTRSYPVAMQSARRSRSRGWRRAIPRGAPCCWQRCHSPPCVARASTFSQNGVRQPGRTIRSAPACLRALSCRPDRRASNCRVTTCSPDHGKNSTPPLWRDDDRGFPNDPPELGIALIEREERTRAVGGAEKDESRCFRRRAGATMHLERTCPREPAYMVD